MTAGVKVAPAAAPKGWTPNASLLAAAAGTVRTPESVDAMPYLTAWTIAVPALCPVKTAFPLAVAVAIPTRPMRLLPTNQTF